jgi:ABC-type sulfate transport system permease component
VLGKMPWFPPLRGQLTDTEIDTAPRMLDTCLVTMVHTLYSTLYNIYFVSLQAFAISEGTRAYV